MGVSVLIRHIRDRLVALRLGGWRRVAALIGGLAVILVALLLGLTFSREPPLALPLETRAAGQPAAAGFLATSAIEATCGWLLEKPGGYLANDLMPPSVWLDNLPAFELGVLAQCGGMARSLLSGFARGSDAADPDLDLAIAVEAWAVDGESWIFPTAERRIAQGLAALGRYRQRLSTPTAERAVFRPQPAALSEWLALTAAQLDQLVLRLTASAARAAAPPGAGVTATDNEGRGPATPWLRIDNAFFHARGTAWATLQFSRALRSELPTPAQNNPAWADLVGELEGGLAPVSSMFILNGKGYGLFANHSLVLATYLAQARAAMLTLQDTLSGD